MIIAMFFQALGFVALGLGVHAYKRGAELDARHGYEIGKLIRADERDKIKPGDHEAFLAYRARMVPIHPGLWVLAWWGLSAFGWWLPQALGIGLK